MSRSGSLLILCFALALSACLENSEPVGVSRAAALTSLLTTPLDSDFLTAEVERLYAEGTLTRGQANSLIAKIAAAEQQADLGNHAAADNIVRALEQEVGALVASGILTNDEGNWLVRIAFGQADIEGVYDYEGYYWIGSIPEFQYARGTLTLVWIDRSAGTFTGQHYRESRTDPASDFNIIRTMEVRNGVFNQDGTFYFDAILLAGTIEVPIPHAGTFDGVTMAGPVQNSINIRFVATKQ